MTNDSSPVSHDRRAGTGIDTTVPHSARIWNYWPGGKDNCAVDREAGEQYKAIFPGIAVVARTSRAFLTRAVRYLAGEAGIRQFLDIGTGLLTADNTHQVAQRVAPGASTNEDSNQAQEGYNASGAVPYHLRSPEQFGRFFAGLDLVEPGVVPVAHWRPDPDTEQPEIYSFCGMARKP